MGEEFIIVGNIFSKEEATQITAIAKVSVVAKRAKVLSAMNRIQKEIVVSEKLE